MRDRKDYRLTVKVRNNNILKAAADAGYSSIPKLASAAGCGYVWLNDLINMTVSPMKYGQVHKSVDKLCTILGVCFDDLFSVEQTEALSTNKSEREIGAEELFLELSRRPQSLDEIQDERDLGKVLTTAVDTLTDRQRLVLNHRMGMNGCDEMTCEELGKQMGICSQRVRQIEQGALRLLRHPNRAKDLYQFTRSYSGAQ